MNTKTSWHAFVYKLEVEYIREDCSWKRNIYDLRNVFLLLIDIKILIHLQRCRPAFLSTNLKTIFNKSLLRIALD